MGGRTAIQGQGNQRTHYVSIPFLSELLYAPCALAARTPLPNRTQLLASRSDRQQICRDCGYSSAPTSACGLETDMQTL